MSVAGVQCMGHGSRCMGLALHTHAPPISNASLGHSTVNQQYLYSLPPASMAYAETWRGQLSALLRNGGKPKRGERVPHAKEKKQELPEQTSVRLLWRRKQQTQQKAVFEVVAAVPQHAHDALPRGTTHGDNHEIKTT